MFIDASVIIAIIAEEEDSLLLTQPLHAADALFVSAVVLYEAITGLARKRACSIEEAAALVDMFVDETQAKTIDIGPEIGHRAATAFALYGKGRHKAALNMGDCFAYACARSLDLPLLFKGNDFIHTDIFVG